MGAKRKVKQAVKKAKNLSAKTLSVKDAKSVKGGYQGEGTKRLN